RLTSIDLATHVSTLPSSATSFLLTLSLHDALPIYQLLRPRARADYPDRDFVVGRCLGGLGCGGEGRARVDKASACHGSIITVAEDRKSTRLNSSHQIISYAVFCLKQKNKDSNIFIR